MIVEEKKEIISKNEFQRKIGEKRLLYDFLAIECYYFLLFAFSLFTYFFSKYIF